MFFARHTATLSGSVRIESEHLLLGLVREGGPFFLQLVPALSTEQIRKKLADDTVVTDDASPPMVMPLSEECKWIVAYAADEADALNHRHIAAEHLLLAISPRGLLSCREAAQRHGSTTRGAEATDRRGDITRG
jgi:ATP-dependent Clp protease ATP-binding subunit ClpC